jgi:hypothetical protein
MKPIFVTQPNKIEEIVAEPKNQGLGRIVRIGWID